MRTKAIKNKINVITLGCSKNIYDSEVLISHLKNGGKDVSSEKDGNIVVINTCGFINQAKAESYAAIEAALENDQEVVVTGCLGMEKESLLKRFPSLKFVSGPGETVEVVNAVKRITNQAKTSLSKDKF